LDINDCIFNNVEKRWLDSWDLWVNCAENYYNPESFRLNLNNCIQTLRSITWLLQKSKNSIPDFNEWYKKQQSQMINDNILKWLKNSRNKIVKQGDLTLHSKAKIAIVTNWLEPPSLEIDIPPFTKTSDFVKVISKKITIKPSYFESILKIERKWVDSELPETELLEGLAHSFKFLTEILSDAHKSLINDKYVEKCSWYHLYNSQKNEIFEGMNSFDWYRTSWFNLKNNEFIDIQEIPINKNLSSKKLKERYSNCMSSLKKFKEAKNFDGEVKIFFEMAKGVLKKDGHHSPIAIIGYPNKSKKIYSLVFRDKTEKILVINKISNTLKNTGAINIILISESWMYFKDKAKYTKKGIEFTDRKEVLSVSALNIKGNEFHYDVIFEKKDNKIFINEDSEGKFTNHNELLLLPIKKAWGIK